MGQISGMGARGLELEKVSQMHRLTQLMAACVQNYFAVPDFSARHSVLVGIFDHITSQRSSYSG